MNRTHYLVYSPRVKDQLARVLDHPLNAEQGVQLLPVPLAELPDRAVPDAVHHALIWTEQADYPLVLAQAREKNLSLGFLPVRGDRPSQFYANLGLPSAFDACLETALQQEPLAIDLILCSGEVVTDGVNLENQTAMSEFIDDNLEYHGFARFRFKLKRFIHAFSLTPHPVILTTAKGKTVTTALTGMVLLDFHQCGALLNYFSDSVSLRDGRISMALFAPQSILSYLQMSAVGLKTKQNGRLPQQIGYLRSESLRVSSPVETHFLVNGKPLTTRELFIEAVGAGIRVNAGAAFRERQAYHDDKENAVCDQLPQQADRIRYLSKTLPFFSHALEADFKELFLLLKDNAGASSSYVLLMVLSALLASLGLFLNSPSVVIGAMVLAPLMAPIISLSMGLLRSDADLSRRSFASLFLGIFIALSLSAAMAMLLPFQDVTAEIEGRLHPSTLDLLVAVLSGVAGAFAHARENIAKSLPGVAIAVALVPPLCVSGIGIGWHDADVFSGAMLLFLTNLTGIIMAAGLTFMVLGFAPLSRARKGLMVSLAMVAMVSVPLYYSFEEMRQIAAIRQQLVSRDFRLDGGRQRLRNIRVRMGQPLKISADLVTAHLPGPQLLALFERQLGELLGRPVSVEFSIRLVTANSADRAVSNRIPDN